MVRLKYWILWNVDNPFSSITTLIVWASSMSKIERFNHLLSIAIISDLKRYSSVKIVLIR